MNGLLTDDQLATAKARIEARLADAHGRVYPTCNRYSTDKVAVDHGNRHGLWMWNGCPEQGHGIGTSNGIASDRMVEQARVTLAAVR